MAEILRLRKHLAGPQPEPHWPAGTRPVAFDAVDPRLLHELLDAAFPGLVAPFENWYGNLTTDSEFDPLLCVPAVTETGSIVGFVQCWTPGFVKDLAVAPAHRGKGVGSALMRQAFALFAARGIAHVDLKVEAAEQNARRLYARLGMVQV